MSPYIIIYYPRNDLNVHDITSAKLKFALSTNSSTRIFNINIAKLHVLYNTILLTKARVIRTLISTVMSSLLYQLSYSPYVCIYSMYTILYIQYIVRTKDLHLYLLDMSQLCYYYINPHIYISIY